MEDCTEVTNLGGGKNIGVFNRNKKQKKYSSLGCRDYKEGNDSSTATSPGQNKVETGMSQFMGDINERERDRGGTPT